MAITVLNDLILSNNVISAGIRGKNIRQNSRVQSDNGFASINVGWSQALRQYEVGTVPMSLDKWQEIEALHEITQGGAFGMLMQDPKDGMATQANSAIKLMPPVGTAPAYYQIQRRYIDTPSGRFRDRPITRPRLLGFGLFNGNGTPYSGTFTLDPNTGRLTMPAFPDPAPMRWSGLFYVPVHFMDDAIDWELLAGGSLDQRLLSGPSVVLQEIKE